MKLETRDFGPVEIDETKVIRMPSGMPGFPGMERFVILDREETRPFLWYQCVDDPGLAFVIIDPYLFKPDYSVDFRPAIKDMSWENDKENLAVYTIVNASEGAPEKITANLIGPLVIHTAKNEAVQYVVTGSTVYSHKYPIFQPGP